MLAASGNAATDSDVDQVRADVREWLAANWHAGTDRDSFREAAVNAGWACPSLPSDLFGRGLPAEATHAVHEEFLRAGAPVPDMPSASSLIVHLISTFGSGGVLRTTILRGFLTGQNRLCLLYSEPGAGSDLAAVQTRAERDGEDWVVNGQKVWTSLARESSHGLLVARTDWDVPKHRGITVFLLPMDQAGVDVRPIQQITGRATFNEVFFDDARVPDAHRIGAVNDGWRVLQTALSLERMHMGTGSSQSRAPGKELVRSPVAQLVEVARNRERNGDAEIRQALARLHSLERIGKWNSERAADMADAKVASIVKLAMSEVLHSTAQMHATLLGADGMLFGSSAPEGWHANLAAMYAFENSIGGGSDQIQRNLIGERALGLPREPAVDRDIPFRDVRKAEAVRSYGSR